MADTIDFDQLMRTVRRGPDGRRLCSIPFCERVHASRGMCKTHHRQWKRTGNPLAVRTLCAVAGCACGGKVHGVTATAPKPPRGPQAVPGWLDLDRLGRVVPREGWERNGACFNQGDTDRFYPTRGEWSAEARDLCETCPARYVCLAAALSRGDHDDHGIWGGTSVRERRRIRKALALGSVAS